MSLLHMYIENINNFDNNLINAWNNEIKPFILQKFPMIKEGLFNVNSDLHFLIKIIDSLKEKYEKQKKELENINTKENNNLTTKNNTNAYKEKKSSKKIVNSIEDEEEEEEMHHRSICIIRKEKRRGTEKKIPELQTIQNYNQKVSSGSIKDKNKVESKNDKKEDNQLLQKENKSKINEVLLEFIEENITPIKRTNSMINLRPHSHTIDSKTTCDTSIKEENSNLNINQLLAKDLDNDNNNDSVNKNDINNNNIDLNKKKEINNNNNNNTEKNPIKMYGNLFMEGEETNTEKNSKIKSHLRSKSINLLREMNPFYKDEIEAEGYSIIKNKEKKLISFIYPDILLKKIIFEDFIKKNVLLIHHFCQQCFCFVNKEIFFKKIFHCYKFYKKNTSKGKLKNLIEFVNILVIEMFEYYQTVNLHDVHIIQIKKFYNELISDLITSIDNYIENNNNSDDSENNDKQFRFESIDYSKNQENINRNSINYNYTINKKNIININLNIEIKDIKIFIFKEKNDEEEKEKNKNKEKPKPNNIDESNIIKSLTFRPSSLHGLTSKILFKDFKEDNKNENQKKNSENKENNENNENNENLESSNKRTILSQKDVIPFNLEEDKEKILDNLEINNEDEIKTKENIEQSEEKEKIEKKQKLFQISKTLRKSNIVKAKKTLNDAIIEEDEDIKEKSEEESKSLYSDKSNSESNSSSSSSSKNESENENENENENDGNEENVFKNILLFTKKETRDIKEKEEENKQKSEIFKNILETNNISENLLSLNEKMLNELKYILSLFDEGTISEPSFIDLKDAKEHIIFYKNLQNILNKQKKVAILPRQRDKRLTKSYSFFNLGSIKPKAVSRDYLKKGYFCVTDWKIEEIGDQLMKVSKSLLIKIYPRELYRAIFLKKEKEKTSPNVVECINKFNRLTSFIIEDILSYDFPKERARIYERWIYIADYCKSNKDFNDLIAIYSALKHYVITGLNLTLKEVRSKPNNIFRQISDFCSVEGNYRNIREDMNNCDRNGVVYIPYLGMIMRDINFFEESSKYINENGCINFDKIEKIHTLFQNTFKFKNVNDKKNKIKELNFFEELEDISEEQLEEMANKLEPEFKLDDIQKPGKRPTNIDRLFFEEYKNNNIFSIGNMKENYNIVGRKTVSIFK